MIKNRTVWNSAFVIAPLLSIESVFVPLACLCV
jgi:hypothetical protein